MTTRQTAPNRWARFPGECGSTPTPDALARHSAPERIG